jgi:multidrug resistance efflux pump
MSVRNTLLILALLMLAAPLTIPLTRATSARVTDAAQPQATAAPLVSRTQAENTVRANGEIEVDDVVEGSFLISGEVAEIYVAEGDFVYAGDPLMRLDNDRQRLSVERALLDVQRETLALEDLREVDEDDVRLAEAQLAAAQAAYSDAANLVTDDDLRAAELRYQQTQDALLAAQEARRIASGNAEYIASLDAQIGAASFDAEIARLQLEDLRGSNGAEMGAAGARIRQAEIELEQIRAGATSFELADQQIVIEQTQAALADAELEYARTVLTAPVDGIVSVIHVEVGERISAGAAALEITDMLPMVMRAEVDEDDISRVAEGMSAIIELDALPGVLLDGTVTRLAEAGTKINGIISYDVDITLDTIDARVRNGMSADADIQTGQN